MIQPHPNPAYFCEIPLLGILATVDTALDTLLGALREQHPEYQSQPANDPWQQEHRYVYATTALAQALQTMILELYSEELRHIGWATDLF
jgi:hypothetical protein